MLPSGDWKPGARHAAVPKAPQAERRNTLVTEQCGTGQRTVPVLACNHLSLCGERVLRISSHRDTACCETWVPEPDIILRVIIRPH